MSAMKSIWMNGRLVAWGEAQVHVLTPTLHHGLGVLEEMTFHTAGGKTAVFRLGDHLDRLYESALIAGLSIPYRRGELREAVRETVRANGLEEGLIRLIVYLAGESASFPVPESCVRVAVAVGPREASACGVDKPGGLRLRTSSFIHPHVNSDLTKARICGRRATAMLARLEAAADGYDGALFLDAQGNVAEGPEENIFVIRRKVIRTPPAANILPGITRDVVIEIARWLGIEVHEAGLSRDEVYVSDEVFVTGTASGIVHVREVDRRPIGTGEAGPMTRQIMASYAGILRGAEMSFSDWLTPV